MHDEDRAIDPAVSHPRARIPRKCEQVLLCLIRKARIDDLHDVLGDYSDPIPRIRHPENPQVGEECAGGIFDRGRLDDRVRIHREPRVGDMILEPVEAESERYLVAESVSPSERIRFAVADFFIELVHDRPA